MIFAVDFDGTLSFGNWPGCGPANKGLIEFLKKRQRNGDKVILWTCREGELLQNAVKWCAGFELFFDAINDNLPEAIAKYGNSRKIGCDFYIDDKSMTANMYKLFET